MPKGRKRNLSNSQTLSSSSKLRRSLSAHALDQQQHEISGVSGQDLPTSQPATFTNTSMYTTRLSNLEAKQPRRKNQAVTIGAQNGNVDKQCGHCDTPVEITELDVLYLECCFCKKFYHSCCLEISESLEPFLHVVTDIGGWSCPTCRLDLTGIIADLDAGKKNLRKLLAYKIFHPN